MCLIYVYWVITVKLSLIIRIDWWYESMLYHVMFHATINLLHTHRHTLAYNWLFGSNGQSFCNIIIRRSLPVKFIHSDHSHSINNRPRQYLFVGKLVIWNRILVNSLLKSNFYCIDDHYWHTQLSSKHVIFIRIG